MGTSVTETQGFEPKRQLTIRERLNTPEFAGEVARVLPKHCSSERMVRVALTALTRTPKLAECTQTSFFQCLMNLSQWGLEPDGRRAHLIPYGNVCTLIVDYKGIVELCFRSGTVKAIHADVVRQGDLFEYSCGFVTKHTPWFLRPENERPDKAGEVFAVYCVVQLKDGAAKHDVMSRDDVEAIRKRSRSGSNGPWVSDWNEMAKKTVFRRCSKWLPWSAEITEAMERDDDRVIEADVSYSANQSSARSLADLTAPSMAAATHQPEAIEATILDETEAPFDPDVGMHGEPAPKGKKPSGELFQKQPHA